MDPANILKYFNLVNCANKRYNEENEKVKDNQKLINGFYSRLQNKNRNKTMNRRVNLKIQELEQNLAQAIKSRDEFNIKRQTFKKQLKKLIAQASSNASGASSSVPAQASSSVPAQASAQASSSVPAQASAQASSNVPDSILGTQTFNKYFSPNTHASSAPDSVLGAAHYVTYSKGKNTLVGPEPRTGGKRRKTLRRYQRKTRKN